MEIKNLTPHNVVIINENGDVVKTFPSEGVARVSTSSQKINTVDEVDIMSTVWGETVDLPKQVNDTLLIVSRLVMTANPDRSDLVAPNDLVRDDQGRVVGARNLSR